MTFSGLISLNVIEGFAEYGRIIPEEHLPLLQQQAPAIRSVMESLHSAAGDMRNRRIKPMKGLSIFFHSQPTLE
jgi:hypothetical protein